MMKHKFVKRNLASKIKRLEKLRRRYHHPLLHHVRKAHHISGRTLYCVKEYGKKSHVSHVIVKESIKILILASVISSIGGIALQSIQQKIATLLPLLILLPALNHMIGSFGTVIAGKFTEFVYTDNIKGGVWRSADVRSLLSTMLVIALISSVYIGAASYAIAYARGYVFSLELLAKTIQLSVIATLVLVALVFFITVAVGSYVCSRQEDPNNFLIPISTSIADLGSMLIYSALIAAFF